MSIMREIWHAKNVRQGDRVWVRTSLRNVGAKVVCLPRREGLILCSGQVVSTGIDSEWDSLISIRYTDCVTKEKRSKIISETEEAYFGCFFVER